jgi:hypothetical protein
MGIIAGANINDNGLIFSLDAANFRSYSGSGLTSFGLVGGIGGTLVNGVGFTSSNGGSFIFDGTNDYIISPSNSNYGFGLNDFTIAAWFKSSDKSNYGSIVNIYDDVNPGIILYSNITNGYFRTWVGNSLMVGNIDVTNGQWNNVVLKRSSGTCTQFVNGIENISTTTSQSIVETNLKIGGIPPYSYNTNGNISQVSIYNRALTAKEIRQNYNATKKRYGL